MGTAFRITQTKYVDSAFDGEGAKLFGGRWNSKGVPMVYTASSLSLATLEILVHVEDYSIIYGRYSTIEVRFPDAIVQSIDPETLPNCWDNPEITRNTQILGDKWIAGEKSAILRVPTVVTKGEHIFLINPAHPDFAKITLGSPVPFHPDPRLEKT